MRKPITDPRPIRGLTKALQIALLIAVPLQVISAAGYAWHGAAAAQLPWDGYLPYYEGFSGSEIALIMTGLAGAAQFIVGLVAGFMALRWTYRANVNAHAMSRGIETSPSWSLWWWFIPVASLFKPFAVMSEIWRSAEAPDRWKGRKDPPHLRIWWAAHIISALVLTASSLMERAAETAAHVVLTDVASVIGFAVQILATLLYVRIIGKIAAAQTQLIANGRRRPQAEDAPAWAV